MDRISLENWAENVLTETEAQLMLIKAARSITHILNPDQVGVEWADRLKHNGYWSLCPFARNYMQAKYMEPVL